MPSPRLAARDPYAIRGLVAILVVASFFAAGSEKFRRIAAAFDWQGAIAPANYRIDAWVSPPTYTGKPPILLQGLRPGEPVQTAIRQHFRSGRQHARHPRERRRAPRRRHRPAA